MEKSITIPLNLTVVSLYCVFIYIFSLRIDAEITSGDFNFFYNSKLNIDFFLSRYQNWSSRLIIEGVLVFFCKHQAIWLLLNGIMMIYVPIGIYTLLSGMQFIKSNIFIPFALVSCYNIQNMSSAGWVPTMLNYYFPLATGLATLNLSFKSYLFESKKYFYIYLFFLICFSLVSCNLEQMALIFLFIYGYILISNILIQQKNKIFIYIPFIISLFSLIFIATTPGNTHRYNAEIKTWFPQYEHFTTLYKLFLGFQTTAQYYFFEENLIFSILIITLFACSLIKNIRIFIPFCSIAVAMQLLLKYTMLDMRYIQEKVVLKANWLNFEHLILYFSIVLVVVLNIALYIVFQDRKKAILVIGIFWVGFASRIIMGFSPTVFASSYRTFLFFDFSCIFIIIFLINDFYLYTKETLNSGKK